MSSATIPPMTKSTIDEITNGIAYFFSLRVSPGVMKRHSCHSQTGSASTMPPYVAILRRVANASSGPVKMNLFGVPLGAESL